MDLDDERWASLLGGYRVAYDPRDALRRLEKGDDVDAAWEELWRELHHQGDVGEASYAAVPYLVRIHKARAVPDRNTYALSVTIEAARRRRGNPDIPRIMREAYERAWHDLVRIGLLELQAARDPALVSALIGAIATGKGLLTLGRLAVSFSDDELAHLFTQAGWG